MSYAFVITELNPGGAERCLVNLAIHMKMRGHGVRVISLAPRPLAGKDELVEKLNAHNIVPDYLGLTRWHQFLPARRRLRALLDTANPSVVQSFLFHANILTAKASKNAPWKLVAGLRVSDPRRFRHWMMRYQRDKFAHTICVSLDVESFASSRLGFDPDSLTVIPNGVDFDHIDHCQPATAGQMGLSSEHPWLAYVGRLDHQKGVDLITHNASEILNALPEHHILIAGEGPQEETLKRQIESQGLQNRVHFLGYRSDAVSIIKSSDLLLFPSRWEGMPNTVMEAMAIGRPVVACPADGIQTLLQHAPIQIAARAKWISRLIELQNSPSLLTDLGESNRNVIQNRYRLSQMIDRYEVVYESLLSGDA